MTSKAAVLVTRPAGQASELVALLHARGFAAFEQPLLQLTKLAELSPQAKQHLENLNAYQHIIFVSTNAVQCSMEHLGASSDRFPGSSNIYAMGDATIAELAKQGIQAASSGGQMTSESLLENDQLQALEGQRVLIVKGQGGRRKLREALEQRGAAVDQLSCYTRSCPALAAGELAHKIRDWDIGTLLISSGEGLCNLLTLLSPSETIKLSTLRLIVPSQRVAQMAVEAGFVAVKVATNASNAAMLERIEQCNTTAEIPGEQ